MDAAGNNVQRADERDESDVFMRRLAQTVQIVQSKKIIAPHDRAEA
jgi:hypothetical protein